MGSGYPGPAQLGRSVVVDVDGQPPPAHLDAPTVTVDAASLRPGAAHEQLVDTLSVAFARRTPLVIRLAVDPGVLKAGSVERRPAHELGGSWRPPVDTVRDLVWANSYDARGAGEPIWWHGRLLRRAGNPAAAGDGDVRIDGADLWVDGGPHIPVGGQVRHRYAPKVAAGSVEASGDEPYLAALDDRQRAAATHTALHARIVAAAGSGKTAVLTARLLHLAAGWNLPASQITAVAYNTRAAAELRARVAGTAAAAAGIVTFHALGWRIVQEARPSVQLLTEKDVRNLIGQIAPVAPLAHTDPFASYLEGFEAVRIGLVAPDEVAERLGESAPDFAGVYASYLELLDEHDAVDFDGQIAQAIELLAADPARRQRWQSVCRHMLIDEFQDATPALLLLARLLSGPTGSVTAVGDDDQTIYSYRGANPDHLVRFADWFPAAASFTLPENYRCPPAVVEGARRLLAHNRRRVDKPLAAARKDGGPDDLAVFPSSSGQGTLSAAGRVREALEQGWRPADIAVLARVGASLLPVNVALIQQGVPVDQWREVSLHRTGIAAALAWLRLAAGPPYAGADVAVAARRSRHRIRRASLDRLTGQTWTAQGLTGYAWRHMQPWEGKQLRELLADIDRLTRIAASGGAAPALRHIGSQHLQAALETLDRSGRSTVSHRDDIDALVEIADLHPEVEGFDRWLTAILARRSRTQDEGGAVTLATVHASKGLGWPLVIVTAVERDVMPHRLAEDHEEERRILHVAMTRASQRCLLLHHSSRPSPLLREIVRPDRNATPTVDRRTVKVGERVTVGPVVGELVEVAADGGRVRTSTGSRVRVRHSDDIRDVDGHTVALPQP